MVPKSAENKAVAEVIQAMAAEAGFDLKIRVTEFATSLKQGEQGNFQVYLIGWSGRTDPDGNIYSSQDCKAPQNNGGYLQSGGRQGCSTRRGSPRIAAKRKAIYETASRRSCSARARSSTSITARVLIAHTDAARGLSADARRAGARGGAEAEVTAVIPARSGAGSPAMLTFLAKRLLQLIPTLFFVSVLIFSLQQLLPGDPALIMAGEDRDPEVIEQIRKQYRLDQPIPVQYLYWMKGVLTGDLGESMRFKQPVLDLVLQKFPVTMQLAVMAFIIAISIGITAGIVSAVLKDTRVGLRRQRVRAVGAVHAELLARHHADLPVLGAARLAAAVGLRAADGGSGSKASLTTIMPAFVLGNALAAVLMRHTRSAMLQALNSDYVRTARAKGLLERSVILKHAMRNALIPVITLGALDLGTLLSGAVLTEQIFTIPGFGKLIVDAVFNRDYAVVQGVVLVTATTYIMLNLLADVLYVLVNPRLRA